MPARARGARPEHQPPRNSSNNNETQHFSGCWMRLKDGLRRRAQRRREVGNGADPRARSQWDVAAAPELEMFDVRPDPLCNNCHRHGDGGMRPSFKLGASWTVPGCMIGVHDSMTEAAQRPTTVLSPNNMYDVMHEALCFWQPRAQTPTLQSRVRGHRPLHFAQSSRRLIIFVRACRVPVGPKRRDEPPRDRLLLGRPGGPSPGLRAPPRWTRSSRTRSRRAVGKAPITHVIVPSRRALGGGPARARRDSHFACATCWMLDLRLDQACRTPLLDEPRSHYATAAAVSFCNRPGARCRCGEYNVASMPGRVGGRKGGWSIGWTFGRSST
jgi:hypothetical protein